jgi:hypothetical protein
MARLEKQGIDVARFSDIGDSSHSRRQLYDLEEAGRAAQPFREVGPYIATPYSKWEKELECRDQCSIFLALAPYARSDGIRPPIPKQFGH